MDVLFFFKERTRFIRQFYNKAAAPFLQTMDAIEKAAPPFDNPPYSEDGEPAYLVEWIEASEALEVLGRTCLSMLSPALQLYFKTWERQLGVHWEEEQRKKAFKKGFLNGYLTCFEQVSGVVREECPADLDLIEEVILARNRDQHPEDITSMRVTHGRGKTGSNKFFMDERDRAMFSDPEMRSFSFLDPVVHVSGEKLFAAILEAENLVDWLEVWLLNTRWGPQVN
jgi:hypothetical protein